MNDYLAMTGVAIVDTIGVWFITQKTSHFISVSHLNGTNALKSLIWIANIYHALCNWRPATKVIELSFTQ